MKVYDEQVIVYSCLWPMVLDCIHQWPLLMWVVDALFITSSFSPVASTVTFSTIWRLSDSVEFENPLKLHSYVWVLITQKYFPSKHVSVWVSSLNLPTYINLGLWMLSLEHTSRFIFFFAWYLGPFVKPHCVSVTLLMPLFLVWVTVR